MRFNFSIKEQIFINKLDGYIVGVHLDGYIYREKAPFGIVKGPNQCWYLIHRISGQSLHFSFITKDMTERFFNKIAEEIDIDSLMLKTPHFEDVADTLNGAMKKAARKIAYERYRKINFK